MSPETLRVGFLMGQSQHETLRIMTESLAQQFRDAGHTAHTFDLLSPASIDEFEVHLRARAFDLIVSFQGWGLNFFDEGLNLFERAHVPYVAILGDHPLYHASRLARLGRRNGVLLMNFDQVDAFRELVKRPVPLGFFGTKKKVDRSQRADLDGRSIPFLFMGSGGDPNELRRQQRAANATVALIVEEALEERSARAPCTSLDALHHVFGARGIDATIIPQVRIAHLVEAIDRIARSERRLRIVRSIRSAPLTIWGPDWPRDIAERPNITLRDSGYPTGLAAAGRARLMLNIFPDEFAVFHDRIALAMEAGTPVLSESTPLFDRGITSRGAAFGFSDPSTIDAIASELLADTGRLELCVAAADAYEDEQRADLAVETVLSLRTEILMLDALNV
jgi:hypothetical protein